jgi:CubicO group peptidase (beta-lactamase class C family)
MNPVLEDASTPRADARVTRRDAGPDAGPPDDLDGFIAWQLDAGSIPGAAMAIVKDGALAWVGTYGFADIESGREVDEHTLFMVASVSKTMVAARAMQLVEQGRLDLDAPLETYLPYPVRHPSSPDVAVTARRLLTHTSGLADNWLQLAAATDPEDSAVTLGEFAEGYLTESGAYWDETNWGARPTGEARDYCNAALGVMGHVIERAGGEDLRAQTEEGLFTPLAMDDAGWLLADIDRARLATPYSAGRDAYAPLSPGGYAFYPATSLRVSVVGLGRFVAALLGGGELDGVRVLSSESVAELFRVQFPEVSRTQALSFYERRVGDRAYIGHSGSSAGNSAQLLLSRDGAHGLVLLTNSDAYLRDRLGLSEGDLAIEAILARLDAEADAL